MTFRNSFRGSCLYHRRNKISNIPLKTREWLDPRAHCHSMTLSHRGGALRTLVKIKAVTNIIIFPKFKHFKVVKSIVCEINGRSLKVFHCCVQRETAEKRI